MKKIELETTPSTWMSQVDGLVAGIHSELNELKKRICCQPTTQQQEAVARVAANRLPEALQVLEKVVSQVPGPAS